MKKHSRLIALLLGVLILLSAAACSGGGGADTSAIEGTDSRTPETTDIITATTEEPYVSVVAPPETTQIPDPPETTDEVTTPAPVVADTLRILIQKDRGEALTSVFADEEAKPLLDARTNRLLYEHSLGFAVYQSTNIVSKVENDLLAANSEYDLMLLLPEDGIELLTAGALENLAEAGIGVTSESAGIRKNLTESLTLGGGTYLLACDALVSDIKSAYALRYNGTPLSSDPVTLAVSGGFTAEVLLTYIAELGDSVFSLDEDNILALYAGVGGNVFVKNEKGLPLSALAEDKTFTEKYTAARALASENSDDKDAVFTLMKITAASADEIFLPIPKLNADSEYASLLDASTVSLLAAPAGVVDGVRLNCLISALNMSSSDYRESVHEKLTEKSGARGKKLIEVIEQSVCLDLGILLGWGDIDDLIADSINKGTDADTLLSDRITTMRNKAVETAARIIADRLGIE